VLELVWIVLACVATAMALGMAWYGFLFTKPWMKAMGWDTLTEQELKEKGKTGGPGYLISMIGAALGGLALWFIFDRSPPGWETFGKPAYGALLGLLFWGAIYVPTTATTVFFESRNWTLWGIDISFRGTVFVLWGLWVGLLHV
jgi:hypothetical protein